MKLIKNGTFILIIGLIGLLTVIGLELYWHYAYAQAPLSRTPQEIAEMDLQPVNINTAAQRELSALPALTEKQIQSILAYREEHGGFDSPEELLHVEGIGKATYQEIILYITVNE